MEIVFVSLIASLAWIAGGLILVLALAVRRPARTLIFSASTRR